MQIAYLAEDTQNLEQLVVYGYAVMWKIIHVKTLKTQYRFFPCAKMETPAKVKRVMFQQGKNS